MLRTCGSYLAGEIVTVPKRLAESWIREGTAKVAGFREGVVTK